MVTTQEFDVIIVGGGLAGLSAGVALKGAGRTFAILEAEARLGGRTKTGPDYLEFGGGYMGKEQNYLEAMVRAYDVKIFSTYLPLDKQWLWQGTDGIATRFPGDDPTALPGNPQSYQLLGMIDGLSLSVATYLSHPWDHPMAKVWDGMSVQAWLDNEGPAGGWPRATREAFVTSVRTAFSAEPKDLSLLFLLWYAANAGSYSALIDVTGGTGAAEGTRFTYGIDDLVQKLAADASTAGPIRLRTRVTNIEHSSSGVTVRARTTANAEEAWRAGAVIVAMSPAAVEKYLTFTPALNTVGTAGQRRSALQKSMPMGKTIKGFATFRSPFWRAQGLMGFLLANGGDPKTRPLNWTLDNCWEPPPGKYDPSKPIPTNPHSLMTFIVGDAAQFWETGGSKTVAERHEAVLGHLEEVYGPQVRTELVSYVDEDWTSGPSLGAPTGVMGLNVLTTCGTALQTPVGQIFWAGTESATEWTGYMDGALSSGIRAVNDVLADFAKKGAPAARRSGVLQQGASITPVPPSKTGHNRE